MATTAISLLRQTRRRKKSPTCWVRGWLRRRDESGFANTLTRELECSDKAHIYRLRYDSLHHPSVNLSLTFIFAR